MTELKRLTAVRRVFEEGRTRGLHSGLQIYVSLRGEVIADGGLGTDHSGRPMDRDVLMPWLSAGKPLTAVAVLKLIEQNRLALDEPVARWIPEFASGGKDAITIRHLLTHTAGFRNVETGWPRTAWSEVIARCCETPLEDDWVPGQTAGYHIASSWFVLGELLQRATRRSFPEALRELVLDPAGMTKTWNGMPADVWFEQRDHIGVMTQFDKGKHTALRWHEEFCCTVPAPGSNTRGPARELGRFYECLTGYGPELLSSEWRRQLQTRQRIGLYDRTLMHVVDFGLGVIVDSNQYGADTVPYGYGRHCSPRTFGHGGSQSSIAFADPEHGLVVACVADSRIGEGRHQKRNGGIVEAVYQDLDLI